MTSDNVVTAPAGPEKTSALDRVLGVFVSPIQTMRSIAALPDWLIPMIVMIVLSGVASYAAAPQIDTLTETRAQLEKQLAGKNIPAAQIDSQAETIAHVSGFFVQWGFLTLPLWILATAAVFTLAFNMMGGRARFAQIFAVTTYGWLPMTLQTLIAEGVIAMRSDTTMLSQLPAASYTNPSAFVDFTTQRPLFMALSTLDLLTFFSLFLMGVGFSFASGLSRRASMTIVGVLWFLTVLLRVVPALLQG